MTTSILLVGVGGQGAILCSNILAAGLLSQGYDLKISEIHGMSQRGGSVSTQIRFGKKIYAPNITLGQADYLVSFEKAEALRYLPYLKKEGTLLTDDYEIHSVAVSSGLAVYPEGIIEELKRLVPKCNVISAASMALEMGNLRVQNVIILGALVKLMNLDSIDWASLVAKYVPQKALELNLKALEQGLNSSFEN